MPVAALSAVFVGLGAVLAVAVSRGRAIGAPVWLLGPLVLLGVAAFLGTAETSAFGMAALEVHAGTLRVVTVGCWLAAGVAVVDLLLLTAGGILSAREDGGWQSSFGLLPGAFGVCGGLVVCIAGMASNLAIEALVPAGLTALAGLGAALSAMRVSEDGDEDEFLVHVRGTVAALAVIAVGAGAMGTHLYRSARELELAAAATVTEDAWLVLSLDVPEWPTWVSLLLVVLTSLALSARSIGRIGVGRERIMAVVSVVMIVAVGAAHAAGSMQRAPLREAWEFSALTEAVEAGRALRVHDNGQGTIRWPVVSECLWQGKEGGQWTSVNVGRSDCPDVGHPLAAWKEGESVPTFSAGPARRGITLFDGDKTGVLGVLLKINAPAGPLGASTTVRWMEIAVAPGLVEDARTGTTALYVIPREKGVRVGDGVSGFVDLPKGPEAQAEALRSRAVARDRVIVVVNDRTTLEEIVGYCVDARSVNAACTVVRADRADRIVAMSDPSGPKPEAEREKRVMGQLDLAALDAAVAGYDELVTACYKREAMHNRRLSGSVVLRFKLGADAVPSDVRVHDSDLGESLSTCVLREFQKMTLVAPEVGLALVTWPVIFTADPL